MTCVEIAEVMRRRRADLGLSQAELAEAAGIGVRQIRRYEAGQQPVLSVAAAIADALKVSLSELAGTTADTLDLTGQWWAGWQTWRDNEEAIALQQVHLAQRGDTIEVRTLTRGLTVDRGGYHWRGEFRLWDNHILLGWYTADDGAIRSKGTMYFVLDPHSIHMSGRWVGLGYDDTIMTGWASMGRNEEDTRTVLDELKTSKPDK